MSQIDFTTKYLKEFTSLIKAWFATAFLLASILLINIMQLLSLIFIFTAPKLFRKINRFFANSWWGSIVFLQEKIWGIDFTFSGDDVPMKENVLVISNHQSMADIPVLLSLAWRKGRLGDLKWFAKDQVKYFPGVGWGMQFLDSIFVKRNWMQDKEHIAETFAHLTKNKIPVWIVSFAEGTRITPAKLSSSQRFAKSRGIEIPKHTLIPRTKGVVATIEGMRNSLDAVYDVTVGYPDGISSIWEYAKGKSSRINIHVTRYEMSAMPNSDQELDQWIKARFVEKDQLLTQFNKQKKFPGHRLDSPWKIMFQLVFG